MACVAAALAVALSLPPVAVLAAPAAGAPGQQGKVAKSPHGRAATHGRAAVTSSPILTPAPAVVPIPVPAPSPRPVTAPSPAPVPAVQPARVPAPLVLAPVPRPLPVEAAPSLGEAPPAFESAELPRVELPDLPSRPAVIVIRELPSYLPPLLLSLLAGLVVLAAVLFFRQRRRRAGIRSLERGKLDFLLLASHELRTPMSVLAGYVSMAEDGSLGELPRAAADALPEMEQKVGEMQAKLDQILLAVSASYGRLRLAPKPVKAGELVAAAVERAVEHGHPRERFRVFGDRDAIAVCDPEHTVLTLSSLLDNAAKFSPDSAPVTCYLERPLIRSRVEITIADRGPGISEEVKSILFRRFGRVAGPRDSHLSGAGLGLYLAREMARAQGGDVVLGETSEHGSEFVLRLPAA